MAVTIVLISVWGRSVVDDVAAVQKVGEDLASADFIIGRVERMIVAEAEELGAEVPNSDLGDLAGDEKISKAIAELAVDTVRAAALPPGEQATVDPAGYLRPVADPLTTIMQNEGIPVEREQVMEIIDGLDPIEVKAKQSQALIGPESPASRTLGVATVIGMVVVAVTGGLTVRLVDERRKHLRSLLTRIAVSSASFAIITGASAWLLDPRGGRAPIRQAVATLLTTKLWIWVAISLVFGTAAILWRTTRPEADSQLPSETPTHLES